MCLCVIITGHACMQSLSSRTRYKSVARRPPSMAARAETKAVLDMIQ
jgi:hypothetical protein